MAATDKLTALFSLTLPKLPAAFVKAGIPLYETAFVAWQRMGIAPPAFTSVDYPGSSTALDPAGNESLVINSCVNLQKNYYKKYSIIQLKKKFKEIFC